MGLGPTARGGGAARLAAGAGVAILAGAAFVAPRRRGRARRARVRRGLVVGPGREVVAAPEDVALGAGLDGSARGAGGTLGLTPVRATSRGGSLASITITVAIVSLAVVVIKLFPNVP